MRVLSGARLYVLLRISSHVSQPRLAQHPASGLLIHSPQPITNFLDSMNGTTYERIRNRTIPQHHLRRHPRMARVVVSNKVLVRHTSFLLDHDRAFHDLAEAGAGGGGIAGGEGGVELHFWGARLYRL